MTVIYQQTAIADLVAAQIDVRQQRRLVVHQRCGACVVRVCIIAFPKSFEY
jgi:hypothetical protein